MAAPVLGKCAVLVVIVLVLYTGYAFRIRDAGSVAQHRGTCGSAIGKCTVDKTTAATTSDVPTHLPHRKFESVSVRGRFAKIRRPPVDAGDEARGEGRKPSFRPEKDMERLSTGLKSFPSFKSVKSKLTIEREDEESEDEEVIVEGEESESVEVKKGDEDSEEGKEKDDENEKEDEEEEVKAEEEEEEEEVEEETEEEEKEEDNDGSKEFVEKTKTEDKKMNDVDNDDKDDGGHDNTIEVKNDDDDKDDNEDDDKDDNGDEERDGDESSDKDNVVDEDEDECLGEGYASDGSGKDAGVEKRDDEDKIDDNNDDKDDDATDDADDDEKDITEDSETHSKPNLNVKGNMFSKKSKQSGIGTSSRKPDDESSEMTVENDAPGESEKSAEVEVAKQLKVGTPARKLEKVRHADKDKIKIKDDFDEQLEETPRTSGVKEGPKARPKKVADDAKQSEVMKAKLKMKESNDTQSLKLKPKNIAKRETVKVTPKIITQAEVTKSEKQLQKFTSKPLETTTKSNVRKTEQSRQKNAITLTELNDVVLHVPTFVLNFTAVEDSACQQHGKIFLRQLRGYKLWALQMLDSNAKIPSGLLRGNVNQFGDFDQCLGIFTRVKLNEQIVKIQGKYCLATIDLYVTKPEMRVPVNLMQSRAFIRASMRDPGHFIPRFTTMNWALCLPAACSAGNAQKAIEDALAFYNVTSGIKFSVNVDPDMCYVKQKFQGYSKETAGVLCFYAMIVCLVIIATCRDYLMKTDDNDKGSYAERIIMSFSLLRTYRALLKDNSSFTGDVTCIHGIRSLSTIALYIAHKLIPTCRMPFTNRVLLTEVANNPISSVLRVSLVYTDSFLLLSGVLTAYNMAKELTTRGEIRWFCRFVTRYIRLTPSLLVIIFWYTFVMEHTGSGPQWNSVVKANADICKKNAWTNLLYIQNYFPFEEMCAAHTHQLALDMQLSLLAPALVYFLQIKPVIGVLLIFFLLQVSATLRYLATVNNNLSLVIFHGMTLKHLYKTANLTYMLSLHRATPYLFGLMLGVFLNYTGKDIKIHKVFVCIGWMIAGALGLWSIFSPWRLARRDYIYDVEDAAHYAVISPVSSALALSWIIFACFTNHGGIINKVLSNYWLVIFSRISYTVYLTQFAVFFFNVGTTRYLSEFGILKAINPLEFMVVIIISGIITLFFDIPMQEVKKVILECTDSLADEKQAEDSVSKEKDSEKTRKSILEKDNRLETMQNGQKLKKDDNADIDRYDSVDCTEIDAHRISKLKRQDARRKSLIRSDTYDLDVDFDNRVISHDDDDNDDDLYTQNRYSRYNRDDEPEIRRRDRSSSRTSNRSNTGHLDTNDYLKSSRRDYKGKYSSMESEEGQSWEFVRRERSLSRSRDGRRTPIMKDRDYPVTSSRGSLPKFVDHRRQPSSESEEEPLVQFRKKIKKKPSIEPRVSDEEDWEEELRIRRGLPDERQDDAGSIGDDELDSLKRRSSAEGKRALLQDSVSSDSMDFWTVSKVPHHLGSSMDPSEPEDENVHYYQRKMEHSERESSCKEETQSGEDVSWDIEQKQESLASGTSLEEEDVSTFDFVLRKDSKRITVQDLSKISSDTETTGNTTVTVKVQDLDTPRTSSGLFKRESIIKSQASEEDPEYLLPERPKLQEQEQEHPFKKAWQLQKSRSEEDGTSGFTIKEVKQSTGTSSKSKSDDNTAVPSSKSDDDITDKQQESTGEQTTEVNIIWQMRSTDVQETYTISKSETENSSETRDSPDKDVEFQNYNTLQKRQSEEVNVNCECNDET